MDHPEVNLKILVDDCLAEMLLSPDSQEQGQELCKALFGVYPILPACPVAEDPLGYLVACGVEPDDARRHLVKWIGEYLLVMSYTQTPESVDFAPSARKCGLHLLETFFSCARSPWAMGWGYGADAASFRDKGNYTPRHYDLGPCINDWFVAVDRVCYPSFGQTYGNRHSYLIRKLSDPCLACVLPHLSRKIAAQITSDLQESRKKQQFHPPMTPRLPKQRGRFL